MQRKTHAPAHPLKGALNRRMKLFGNLADTNRADRTIPRKDMDDVYVPAPDVV